MVATEPGLQGGLAPAARRVVPGASAGTARLRVRLGVVGWPMSDRALGWVLPLIVTALAIADRLIGVTVPRDYVKAMVKAGDPTVQKMFDETYYAPEARSLLQHGVELRPDGTGDFVVHPPLGKWMIALGEQVFGYNELGWRFASVVAGSLMVLVFARMVRRLTRSTLLGTLGGLLLALDGLQFVLSRTAILDIFLTNTGRSFPAGAKYYEYLAPEDGVRAPGRIWFSSGLGTYNGTNPIAD